MSCPPSIRVVERVKVLQKILIEKAERFLHGESVSPKLRSAFIDTPRHFFTPRFQNGSPGLWSDVNEDFLLQHLETLYEDQPYCIFKNEAGETTSTISQPSLVLFMLHLLDIKPGQRVFELGGGSGWNAALMSRLVGSEGCVISIEIEASLVANAQLALTNLGIGNVSLHSGDAYSMAPEMGLFDRGVFTAAGWGLPAFFFHLIKENGLLLFVFKFSETRDFLTVLRKTGPHFVSELHFPCRFVPITSESPNAMTGKQSHEETAFFQKLDQQAINPEDLGLEIHPLSEPEDPTSPTHLFRRGDSQFVWQFPL